MGTPRATPGYLRSAPEDVGEDGPVGPDQPQEEGVDLLTGHLQ